MEKWTYTCAGLLLASHAAGAQAQGAPAVETQESSEQRLDDVVKTISNLPFGTTDCSLPFTWAMDNKLPVESFSVYTDNETYAGSIAPSEALKKYRQKTGLAAKSVVVGMTASKFTIADPKDSGMMDVVGFDTAAPQIMSDFFAK